MSSHEGETYQCVLRSTCWRDDWVDEYATVVSLLGYLESLHSIAHIERNDRTLCLANLETFLTETLQGVVGNIPQLLETLLWLLECWMH